MEAVLTRPKQSYKFDHKLTDEEVEELIENYDYDPVYDQDEDREPEPMFDKFGNPTRDTIASMYEMRHGLGHGPFTLDGLFAEFQTWQEEADIEGNKTQPELQA